MEGTIIDAGQVWEAINQLYCGVGIASSGEGMPSNAGEKRKAAADSQGARVVVEGSNLDAGQVCHQPINQLYLGVGFASIFEGIDSNARKKREAAADGQGSFKISKGIILDAGQEGQPFIKHQIASVARKLPIRDASHVSITGRFASYNTRFVEFLCETSASVWTAHSVFPFEIIERNG